MDFWTIKRLLEMGGYNFTVLHNDNTDGVSVVVESYNKDDFIAFEFDKLGFLIPLK
jgi:hypothetical protein